MKLLLSLALLVACGDNLPPPSPDGGWTELATKLPKGSSPASVAPIPHTGPGVVTCWRSSSPGATCNLTGTNHCNYAPSYGMVGSCSTTYSPGNSSTTCDGPEDCASGASCCATYRSETFGQRYDARCQASACAPAPNVTLCNPSLAATGCPAGHTCTRAGDPDGPFTVQHSGLQKEMWFCKAPPPPPTEDPIVTASGIATNTNQSFAAALAQVAALDQADFLCATYGHNHSDIISWSPMSCTGSFTCATTVTARCFTSNDGEY